MPLFVPGAAWDRIFGKPKTPRCTCRDGLPFHRQDCPLGQDLQRKVRERASRRRP